MKTINIYYKQQLIAKTFVDDEDYISISKFSWKLNKDGYAHRSKYIGRIDGKKKHENIFLHGLLLECPQGMVIDHINQDKLDNRKSNLRIATKSMNACNSKRKKSSKYYGVCLKKTGFWEANIYMNGKLKYLGCSKNEEEMAEIYNVWSKKVHGEYAVINSFGK